MAEFLGHRCRIVEREQRLQQIDRQATATQHRLQHGAGGGQLCECAISPAWKSHGAASNARPLTRSGRNAAAAVAKVPPMQ